jgi:hypothetical protein
LLYNQIERRSIWEDFYLFVKNPVILMKSWLLNLLERMLRWTMTNCLQMVLSHVSSVSRNMVAI